MEMKVIKSKPEHNDAMVVLEKLLEQEIEPGSKLENDVDVLVTLIEAYENKNFPMSMPTPIEAIKFRMEQQNLIQKDLVPYIGSSPKVSEVLRGKRPLSLSMIRKLSKGLEIPLQVLIQDEQEENSTVDEVILKNFPVKEMQRRGYFGTNVGGTVSRSINKFFDYMSVQNFEQSILMRSSVHNRSSQKSLDEFAFLAWQARVSQKADEDILECEYKPELIDAAFLRRVAQESWSSSGPVRAKELLNHHGIHLIFEEHLPKTYLDGAAFWSKKRHPIIGLTFRHDRADNFWFTLMHELSHVALHLKSPEDFFFDDLKDGIESGGIEKEADDFAAEALIPLEEWESARLTSTKKIEQFAKELGIHAAIVAGRIQKETGNYRKFASLVKNTHVKHIFAT